MVLTELGELQVELKDTMLMGNWDKAIEIVNKMDKMDKMKEAMLSKLSIPPCKSYGKNGKCSEQLYLTFFPGQFITIPCPFYSLDNCKIGGDISSYIFEPTHSQLKNPKTRRDHYANLEKIGFL